MIRCRVAAWVVAGAVAVTSALVSPEALATTEVEWREVCTIDDDRLVEISGMAMSNTHANVMWFTNDSGDEARLYAVDIGTCRTVGEVRLRGVRARDFEGLSSSTAGDGRAFLWIGDIGDNRDSWPDISIYRIREPRELGLRNRKPRQWRFTYPDRPHNAETLMVQGERTWVATWQLASGGLYSVPLSRGTSIARRVADVGALTTDGAINPSGTGYVLRDYLDVHVFRGLPPGRRIATFALPTQVQGEAVTWTRDGRGLFIASEKDARLLRVDLPPWVLTALDPPGRR